LEDLTENPDKRMAGGAERALTYVKRLRDYEIWGSKDIPLDELVKPKRMSVIDLAGLQRKMFKRIIPVFLMGVKNAYGSNWLSDFPCRILPVWNCNPPKHG